MITSILLQFRDSNYWDQEPISFPEKIIGTLIIFLLIYIIIESKDEKR